MRRRKEEHLIEKRAEPAAAVGLELRLFELMRLVYKALQRDLAMLGLRGRRTHDTRRTMITLSLNDGVRRDVLESITHGRKEQQSIDLYNSPLWSLKCEELAKLKVAMKPRGSDIQTALEEPEKTNGPVEVTRPLAAGFAAGGIQVLDFVQFRAAPTTGLEKLGANDLTVVGADSRRERAANVEGQLAKIGENGSTCSKLAAGQAAPPTGIVTSRLIEALARWTADGNEAELRIRLLGVLLKLQ